MSHFTRLEVCLTNKSHLRRLSMEFGWKIEEATDFTNHYLKEKLKNATVFRDNTGNVKLVLDATGKPVVDDYFMGDDYRRFIKRYQVELLKEQACLNGMTFREIGEDPRTGELIVEVED